MDFCACKFCDAFMAKTCTNFARRPKFANFVILLRTKHARNLHGAETGEQKQGTGSGRLKQNDSRTPAAVCYNVHAIQHRYTTGKLTWNSNS